jgi:hypothetical protein
VETNHNNEFQPLEEVLDSEFIDQITSDFRVMRNWKVKIVSGEEFNPKDVSYKG